MQRNSINSHNWRTEYFTFTHFWSHKLPQIEPEIVKTAKLSAPKSLWCFIIELFSKQDAEITWDYFVCT